MRSMLAGAQLWPGLSPHSEPTLQPEIDQQQRTSGKDDRQPLKSRLDAASGTRHAREGERGEEGDRDRRFR